MMPEAILAALCCPVCRADLRPQHRTLSCPAGHTFDIARQGYINLQTGQPTGTADTADMVAARAEFLAAGHYQPIAETLGTALPAGVNGLIVDVGAGTGYYLATLLDPNPDAHGLAVEVSKYALRRAARVHPRAAAIGADAWQQLPVRDGAASVIVNVFAPRNAAEFHRVLRADGVLIIVTPRPAHLQEAVTALNLLGVDQRKDERVANTLGGRFHADAEHELTFRLRLDADGLAQLARMGPTGHHTIPDDLTAAAARVATPLTVTVAVTVTRYRPAQV